MKIFGFVLALCVFITVQVDSQDIFSIDLRQCDVTKTLYQDYRASLVEFASNLYRIIGATTDKSYVFFPLSAWIILGALAEGTDYNTKQKMLQFLRLPNDPCTRLQYYQLATSRFVSNDDIHILSSRALVIDEGVTINPIYHNFVFRNSLFDVVSAPLRSDPQTALNEIKRITSARLTDFDLSGNSVILDTVQYGGLWSTAFEDAVIERSPFYSPTGVKIGSVDLMKVKKRARITYFRPLEMEALELPVGHNDRYRMIIALPRNERTDRAVKTVAGRIFEDLLRSFRESQEPIEIAIPRVKLSTEYDVRKVLENATINNLWKDPAVTRFISDPGALPTGYVQSSTIVFDQAGLITPRFFQYLSYNEPTGYYSGYRKEFIVNRPFLMGLFDAETYSCIMSIAFTKPTYTD